MVDALLHLAQLANEVRIKMLRHPLFGGPRSGGCLITLVIFYKFSLFFCLILVYYIDSNVYKEMSI